jgi:GNAT superfamily N-acetyltransferase
MSIFIESVENLDQEVRGGLDVLLSLCSSRYIKYKDSEDYIVYARDNAEFLFAAILRFFPKISEKTIEIYDVCVHPKYRGKGIGAAGMNYIISNFASKYTLWLGVVLSNISVSKFYANLGFKKIWLTQMSPAGILLPNREYFISMIYSPQSSIEIAAENVSKFYQVGRILNSPAQNFNYDSRSFEKLYFISMKKTVEYGFVVDYVGNKLSVLSSSYVTGTEKGFTVSAPTYIFNGHTHPLSAQVQYYSLLGWPSGQDFLYLAANPEIIQHYVLSYRGIYAIQTTLALRLFYMYLTYEQKKIFLSLIHTKLTALESFRSVKNFDPKLFDSMIYLLSKCKTETFYKAFMEIIEAGGCSSETNHLADGYNDQFLSTVNSLTFKDFNVNVNEFRQNSNLLEEYISNKIVSNMSTLFSIKFFKYKK